MLTLNTTCLSCGADTLMALCETCYEAERQRQAKRLDYGTIRAQRLKAEDVCSEERCTEPVVAHYGGDVFDGAGIVFRVVKRFCAAHDAAFQKGRIFIERC